MNQHRNLQVYNRADVVAFYRISETLLPPEQFVFERYFRDGMDVLDLGVGGGRTTAFLAPRAGRYLGIDYASAMVAVCRSKFPALEFAEADATDLSFLSQESFDFTIFSFNGIDYIPTDEGRIACLKEMRRVTRPGGWVVISSHNARVLGIYPQLAGAGSLKKLWRVARAAALSVPLALRTLRSSAYRTGAGFITDPVHGRLLTHVSTMEAVARDATLAGLEVVDVVGGHYPRTIPQFLNPWNTYVMRRVRA